MKKSLSTWVLAMTALVICTGTVNAQEKFATFGVKAGANLSTMNGDIKKTNYVFKYQFGLTADLAFTENFYLITGLELQTKGTKSKPHGSSDTKFNPMYLQIPVHAAYKFNVADNTKLVFEAGPYVAYGISGKMKTDGSKVNIFGDDRFKRFDMGAGAAVGVEVSKFVIKTGYDFGILDVCKIDGVKARNHGGYVTVGYQF